MQYLIPDQVSPPLPTWPSKPDIFDPPKDLPPFPMLFMHHTRRNHTFLAVDVPHVSKVDLRDVKTNRSGQVKIVLKPFGPVPTLVD